MDDFEKRCLRKKRQVFVEQVELSTELLEDLEDRGLVTREQADHILVSTHSILTWYSVLIVLTELLEDLEDRGLVTREQADHILVSTHSVLTQYSQSCWRTGTR